MELPTKKTSIYQSLKLHHNLTFLPWSRHLFKGAQPIDSFLALGWCCCSVFPAAQVPQRFVTWSHLLCCGDVCKQKGSLSTCTLMNLNYGTGWGLMILGNLCWVATEADWGVCLSRAEEVPLCHLLPVWPDSGHPCLQELEDARAGLCHFQGGQQCYQCPEVHARVSVLWQANGEFRMMIVFYSWLYWSVWHNAPLWQACS